MEFHLANGQREEARNLLPMNIESLEKVRWSWPEPKPFSTPLPQPFELRVLGEDLGTVQFLTSFAIFLDL